VRPSSPDVAPLAVRSFGPETEGACPAAMRDSLIIVILKHWIHEADVNDEVKSRSRSSAHVSLSSPPRHNVAFEAIQSDGPMTPSVSPTSALLLREFQNMTTAGQQNSVHDFEGLKLVKNLQTRLLSMYRPHR
jgi:hypothetical protein